MTTVSSRLLPIRFCLAAILGIGFLTGMPRTGWSQDQRSELGERQRLVERKMQELENTFTSIALKLQEQDPERAQRLIAAYQQAKEQLITQKMAEAAQLLDSEQYPAATRKLDEVVQHIADLVRLLRNEDNPQQSKQEEIAELQAWQKAIRDLQQEQRQQTRETNQIANKEETLDRLAQQVAELKQLIEGQRKVLEETRQSGGAGLRALDRIANRQFGIRQQTEDLARQIAADPATPSGGAQESEGGTGNPSENSGQSESGQSESGQSESGQSQSGQSQSGQSQSGQSQSPQPPQPGQQPLERASEHQRRAEEKLGSGQSTDAERQQESALEELSKALDDLEKERRRIESLPPEAFEEMARQQRRTRDKALDVVKKMEESPAGGDESSSSEGGAQPGQDSMQQAAENMQQGAQDLENSDPEKAERQQREAERQMQQAMDDIEERLNQLREETREEKLARLESRFREMLERQRIASVMTIELEDKRLNIGLVQRRDELLMLRLATEEEEISELGQQAYDLLLEDGTSIAFPEIVMDLRADLGQVSELLQSEQTGQYTQLLQKEVESTLEELLDALAETKDQGDEGGGGGGGGGGGDQPLLKKSAELKLMRSEQGRLNRRTQGVDRLRGDDPNLAERYAQELIDLSTRQRKLLEMAEKVAEEGNQ